MNLAENPENSDNVAAGNGAVLMLSAARAELRNAAKRVVNVHVAAGG